MKKLLLLLIAVTPFINAQQAISSSQPDTLTYELKQISVSATRYAEQILELPYAVTILQAKQLKNLRGYGLDEALSTIPGVLAQSRSGNQDVRLVIRGFGARGAGDRSNSGTSRGIRVMIDGIPETEPDGRTSFDQIDLSIADNIEVIRSNASAIWGNAAGGVVNLSTVPTGTENVYSLRTIAGSFGFNQVQLIGNANFRNGKIFSSFSNSNLEGWRKHSSSFRTLLNFGIVSFLNDVTKLGLFVSGTSNMFHIPGPLTQKQFDADPTQSNLIYEQRDERRFNRLGKVGLTLNHEFDNSNGISGMIFVNPKYLQRSERGTFRDFTRYHLGGNFIYSNHSSFSSSIQNKLVVGVDEAYQDGAILFYSLSSTNSRGNELKDNKREGANTFGAFVQDEVVLNEKLSLIFGGRYDMISYYSESFITSGYGLQSKIFERITPKAGITYRLSETQSLYANLGGGIEVPAGNETDPSSTYGQDKVFLINPLLEPIVSTTYELGTKHLVSFEKNDFVRSVYYDVALYLINVKNDIIPYRGGRFYFTAGKTERSGIELGTTIQFTNGFSFNGAFTFSNNKYQEYRVDSVHYDLQKAGKFADYSGNKAAGIPELFYNFGLTYSPSKLNGAFISIGLNGIGKYFVDDANTLSVPSFNVLNATIGLNRPIVIAGDFTIRGFLTANNLFDLKYASSAFINPDIVNKEAVFLEPGMPRNIVLSISIGY
ncbi:MAG: TonB-dependent receptor [Ignavibacteriales bacterium]|nr:TonB-dependent receptor [Ignavibacteriales bacterium]